MALILIAFGFRPEQVYQEMGGAEFQFHFLTASKLLLRAREWGASTLLNAVGSLFVKSGEKTAMEEYQAGIMQLDALLGAAKDKVSEATVKAGPTGVDKFFEQFAMAMRR